MHHNDNQHTLCHAHKINKCQQRNKKTQTIIRRRQEPLLTIFWSPQSTNYLLPSLCLLGVHVAIAEYLRIHTHNSQGRCWLDQRVASCREHCNEELSGKETTCKNERVECLEECGTHLCAACGWSHDEVRNCKSWCTRRYRGGENSWNRMDCLDKCHDCLDKCF